MLFERDNEHQRHSERNRSRDFKATAGPNDSRWNGCESGNDCPAREAAWTPEGFGGKGNSPGASSSKVREEGAEQRSEGTDCRRSGSAMGGEEESGRSG